MPKDESMADAIARLTSSTGSNSNSNVPKMTTRIVNEGTETISKGLRTVNASLDDDDKLEK